MKKPTYSQQQIIAAGKKLQLTHKVVTPSTIRHYLGGGNVTRIKAIWQEWLQNHPFPADTTDSPVHQHDTTSPNVLSYNMTALTNTTFTRRKSIQTPSSGVLEIQQLNLKKQKLMQQARSLKQLLDQSHTLLKRIDHYLG